MDTVCLSVRHPSIHPWTPGWPTSRRLSDTTEDVGVHGPVPDPVLTTLGTHRVGLLGPVAILFKFWGPPHRCPQQWHRFTLPPAVHRSPLPSSSPTHVFCLENRWVCALLTVTMLRAEPAPLWPLPPLRRHCHQSRAGLCCMGPLPSLLDVSLGWATSVYSHCPGGTCLLPRHRQAI